MKSPHILLLNKNVVELKNQLSHILDKKSARAFDTDIGQNVVQLFALGLDMVFTPDLPVVAHRPGSICRSILSEKTLALPLTCCST